MTFRAWGACAVGGVALLGIAGSLVSGPAYAEPGKPGDRRAARRQDPGQKIIPSVEFHNVDLREAVRSLFRGAGVSYSISPEVQGIITVSLRNVVLETALQNILRQVDATYRIESGVYDIVLRESVGSHSARPAPRSHSSIVPEPNVPSAVTSDGGFLYVVQSRRLYKVRKSDLRVVARGDLQQLVLERVDVRAALEELSGSTGITFKIPPDLRGKVTMTMGGNRTFGATLEEILRQVGATYRIEAGVYTITARKPGRR